MGRELPREGEVVQPGDAEHGGVNAVAFQAAVTKDLPCLHPLDDVLDAGPDLAVGGIVLLFPSWQFGLAAFTAVRNEQAGAPIAPSAMTVARPTAAFAPESSHALQPLRLPVTGREPAWGPTRQVAAGFGWFSRT